MHLALHYDFEYCSTHCHKILGTAVPKIVMTSSYKHKPYQKSHKILYTAVTNSKKHKPCQKLHKILYTAVYKIVMISSYKHKPYQKLHKILSTAVPKIIMTSS